MIEMSLWGQIRPIFSGATSMVVSGMVVFGVYVVRVFHGYRCVFKFHVGSTGMTDSGLQVFAAFPLRSL